MQNARAVCPSRRVRSFAVATSQRRTVRSSLTDARVLPSGAKATRGTLPCPTSVAESFPVATSQSLIVLSQLPEASVLPSGEKTTELTPCLCPSSVRSSVPVEASRRVAFPGVVNPPSAAATIVPSGE